MNREKISSFLWYFLIITIGIILTVMTGFYIGSYWTRSLYQSMHGNFEILFGPIYYAYNDEVQKSNLLAPDMCLWSSSLYIIGYITLAPTLLVSVVFILMNKYIDDDIDITIHQKQLKRKFKKEKSLLICSLFGGLICVSALIIWSRCMGSFADILASEYNGRLYFMEVTNNYLWAWGFVLAHILSTIVLLFIHKSEKTLFFVRRIQMAILSNPV
jgi:hypothetical protein